MGKCRAPAPGKTGLLSAPAPGSSSRFLQRQILSAEKGPGLAQTAECLQEKNPVRFLGSGLISPCGRLIIESSKVDKVEEE